MLAGPASLVALICGWITTEVGRQPWIVYETMRTSEAVTASDGLEIGFAVLGRDLPGAGRRRRLAAAAPDREAAAHRGAGAGPPLMLPELCAWPDHPRHHRLRRVRQRRLRRRLLGPHGRRRRPRRTRARHDPALDEPGVGGQPRVADLRAGHRWTAFPVAFGSLFSTLIDPAVPRRARDHLPRHRVRAARPGGDDRRGARARRGLRALVRARSRSSSAPRWAAIASGRVPVGNAAGDPVDSWLNPTVGDDRRARRPHGRLPRGGLPGRRRAARRAARPRARRSAPGRSGPASSRARRPWAGCSCCARMRASSSTASPPAPGWSRWPSRLRPGSSRSASCGRRRFGLARVSAALAVGGDHRRLGARPGPVPPARPSSRSTRRPRATPRSSPWSSASALGFVILVPSLWCLYRLVLRGTLDQEYEPLDQRFQPVRAGDSQEERR